jgi:hypothetical protein
MVLKDAVVMIQFDEVWCGKERRLFVYCRAGGIPRRWWLVSDLDRACIPFVPTGRFIVIPCLTSLLSIRDVC